MLIILGELIEQLDVELWLGLVFGDLGDLYLLDAHELKPLLALVQVVSYDLLNQNGIANENESHLRKELHFPIIKLAFDERKVYSLT